MRFLITGGTGLIGRAICKQLLLTDNKVTVFSRQHSDSVKAKCGEVNVIHSLDDYTPEQNFHMVINLAGEPIIDKPWSQKRKAALLASRVDLTTRLVSKIQQAQTPPKLLLSGSAVGFYGNQTEPVDDINDDYQTEADFASELCQQWEDAVKPMANSQTRTVILRTGLVLSANGGILKKMQLPFKLGLGGPIGDGKQMMSWIHIDDYVRAINHLCKDIDSDQASQLSYNLVAPNPVSNYTFSLALANAYGWKKMYLKTPAMMIKLIFGERASMLLDGQAALPARLQSENFSFIFSTIDEALVDLIRDTN